MTVSQKNIQLIKEKLLSHAETKLNAGFSEVMSLIKDIMPSVFNEEEIDAIYDELDEAGALDFLLKREFMFLEKGKINEIFYWLESEGIDIVNEMEEIAPEYEN